MTLFIVDISSNNHPNDIAIDWNAAISSGVQGVIIKVNEETYINPFLKADYDGAEAAGIACLGCYDFARPDLCSGADEARLFLAGISAVDGIKPGTRKALDLEEHRGSGPQIPPTADLKAYALDWASIVWPAQLRKDTAMKPLLYSRLDYLIAHNLINSSELDKVFDLWLVSEVVGIVPPPGWSDVSLFQIGQHTIDGLTGPVDVNIFPDRAYGWLSKAWGYQIDPLSQVTTPPDVDPNADAPTIARAASLNIDRAKADLDLLRTKWPGPI